ARPPWRWRICRRAAVGAAPRRRSHAVRRLRYHGAVLRVRRVRRDVPQAAPDAECAGSGIFTGRCAGLLALIGERRSVSHARGGRVMMVARDTKSASPGLFLKATEPPASTHDGP